MGALGFDWYSDRPEGVTILHARTDPSRRSASWFMHRLPARTEVMVDLSSDPVISLEFEARGAIERAVEGRKERAVLSSDALTLTPALAACVWQWEGAPLDIMDMYIPQELLQAAWAEHRRGDPVRVNLAPRLLLQDPGLIWLLRSVFACGVTDSRQNSLYFETMTAHLVAYLIHLEPTITTVTRSPAGALPMAALRRVKAYIEEQLAADLSLEDLAAVAGVSRFHFARQFRAVVGETPHGYLVRRRLERARDLLTDSRLPISEVAATCGFPDPSHFAKRFRREYRIAPAEYRRTYR